MGRYALLLLLLLASCGDIWSKSINELVHHRSHPASLAKALHFLHNVQTPADCSGPYATVSIGLWGGFAAQFQLAAAEWMRALAGLNFSVPVLIQGRLMGYSDGQVAYLSPHILTNSVSLLPSFCPPKTALSMFMMDLNSGMQTRRSPVDVFLPPGK